MDIYQIMARLDAIGSKNTLTESQNMAQPVAEGQMKRSLEARAEQMSKADFVASAGEYGMSTDEAAEFWTAVNGEDEEVDEAYEKLPKDQLGLDKFSQAALSGGQRKRDALANPDRARMLAKKSAQQQPVKEVITTPIKKGDRVSVEGKPAVVVGQMKTPAGSAKYFAVQFDGKQYPGNTYDQVHANRLFPADVEEGNEFSGELAQAKASGAKEFEVDGKSYPVREAKKSKPDFLDMDKDGDKKEPMKKAVADKKKGAVKESEQNMSRAAKGYEKYGKQGMQALSKAGKEGKSLDPIRKKFDKYDESAKPDFLDIDKDGDKKEPMKKAAKDKNDAKGSFQKQMGGSAKELTKGLSIGAKKVDEASKNLFPGTPEYELRFGKDDASSAFDKKKISTGTVYSRKHQEEPEADDDAPRAAGRPKGAKRRLGAKGPSVDSKLLKGKSGLKEEDMEEARNPDLQKLRQHHLAAVLGDRAEKARARAKEKGYDTRSTRAALDAQDAFGVADSGKDPSKYGFDVSKDKRDIGMKEHSHDIDIQDQGEYDREGDMALSQVHQIADAARELHAILASDDNLPEWVQSKITKALDYIDTARDYLGAEKEMDREELPEIAPIVGAIAGRALAGAAGAGRIGQAAGSMAGQGIAGALSGDNEVEEAGYSAKAARAGKDIGKPGKQFSKIAKGAAERYGSKERGEKVAGAVLAKLRAKEGVESVEEKAPPGAKAERMVKHIKKGYAKDGGLTDREKAIAYATAWKAKKAGKVEEEGLEKHSTGAVKAAASKDRAADKKSGVPANISTAELKAELKRRSQVEEESTDTKDQHAEKAGKKVTKDIEYDDKKDKEKKVDETTVSGSVATGGDAPKKSKGGMQFGQGVYEGAIAESFNKKLGGILTEGMSVNVSTDDTGKKSITVNATDADADSLGNMLKMAGLFSSEGYSRTCEHCHGIHEAGACQAEQVDEELANSPDEVYADKDYMTQTLSGGLNGPKTTGQTTGPVINRQDNRQGVMAEAERVVEQSESRLWNLYKQYDKK